MEAFIANVAQFILSGYNNPGDVCVVLPNRRAGLFLKKELTSRLSAPAWSPAIFSIEDFVFGMSGLQPCDQSEQLLALFRIVRATPGHEDESFDGFCKWAPALLADFTEADLWLADPKKLFGNLTEIKHMEHWSLGEPGLTDFQKKYLHFYDQLGSWYEKLRAEILSRGKAWSGLAHRLLAENKISSANTEQWAHYVFAGFNALSSSQEKIFSTLASSGKAEILWDADRYYLEDPLNEAGHFMRRNREKFFGSKSSVFEHVHDYLATSKKNITLIAAARNVSQARAAAGFLDEQGKDFQPDQTAIVLADEQLLIPMLNALPSRYGDVNITMGYPMRATPVYTLLHILFSLQENAARLNVVSKDGELKYYHHDVTRLLRHPYIVASASSPGVLINIIQTIARRNLTFISPAQFVQMGGAELVNAGWFIPWKSGEQCIVQLQVFIELLRKLFADKEAFALDVEYVYQFHLALNRISTLVDDWKDFSSPAAEGHRAGISSIKNLLLQVFGSATIPFSGEPLAGLQLMGLLESRCLDFKNVILVSANEGVLPSQSSQHSFIMYDLRKAFDLPVHQERDALAAYHFYRLIQRAENICIVYNTDQDTFGVKEKSRFVSQLMYELPQVNKQLTIRNLISGAELQSVSVSDEIRIESSPEIAALAAAKAADGFSPSLINLFRECRLKFYFRYIAGLREEKEVEENVDQNTLGTIMHAALEKLYTPFLEKPLQPADLESMKGNVSRACREAFYELFPDEETDAGKNHLAGKIAQRYIGQYLEQETERIASQIRKGVDNTVVGLEQTLEAMADVDGVSIRFKGNADRIDKMGKVVRLIDYKTGLVESQELRIAGIENFTETDKYGKAFQLMMYAWLYLKSTDSEAVMQPGIISFRKLKKGFLHLETPAGNMVTKNTLGDFGNVLMEITRQIISPTTAFTQTTNVQLCRNCEFNLICRRS